MTYRKPQHPAHKVKRAIHRPMVRLVLFLAVVCVSVVIVESLHASHLTLVSLPLIIQKGIEVFTDVVCDRLFPEV